MNYSFLLSIALILLFTKLFGLATAKVHLPQVVGALVAGILLGPGCFGILHESNFLTYTAEIGVILLMFIAGIDTDMNVLKKTGPAACLIATLGVFVPIFVCSGVYLLFFVKSFSYTALIKALFIGVVFAATSVSITVETLNEMGKLQTNVGATLLSAAIIDDIIGVVVLSVLSGLGDDTVNPYGVVAKIGLFFLFTFIVGLVVYRIFKMITIRHSHTRRLAVWALAFCFIMSYCAEKLFGVADITGAFFAGVILCNLTDMKQFVAKKLTVASYLFFTPVFFAGIGLKIKIESVGANLIFFTLCLIIAAVGSKIIGCGLAAKICKMSNSDSLKIGVGMIARGEVALMVAQKGILSGYIDPKILPSIVICVVFAALITPIILKWTYSGENK
ncbi:MAG TPA: sodium:proton antiporter [Ruminococcaceae bacterium]|nr:sodium:proton antiporter [Oscillospiraceae bacterium]